MLIYNSSTTVAMQSQPYLTRVQTGQIQHACCVIEAHEETGVHTAVADAAAPHQLL